MHIRLQHASWSSKLVGMRKKEGDGDAIDTGFLVLLLCSLSLVCWSENFSFNMLSIESECNFCLLLLFLTLVCWSEIFPFNVLSIESECNYFGEIFNI